jgi:hypothetical protein
LNFLNDSPIKMDAGNSPNKIIIGTIIKGPPCLPLVQKSDRNYVGERIPFVHAPLVSLSTSKYHGTATANMMMPHKNFPRKNFFPSFFPYQPNKYCSTG